MNLELILMSENDIAEFKKNVQCAFQKGFEDVFGKCEETILPEKDIDQSLNGKGSVVYKAVLDGETVGGVIVAIDTATKNNNIEVLQTTDSNMTIWCLIYTKDIEIAINLLHEEFGLSKVH